MSNFTDHRDKPETVLHKSSDESVSSFFFSLINSQKLICLFNKRDGKMICLAEFDKPENQSILSEENSGVITEIEENAFHSIWNEIKRLKSEASVKAANQKSSEIQLMLVLDTMLKSLRKEEVRYLRTVMKDFYPEAMKITSRFNGKVLSRGLERFFIAFESMEDAIYCSSLLRTKFYDLMDEELHPKVFFRMGLSLVKNVMLENGSTGVAVKRSQRLCNIARDRMLISSDFMELAKSEIPEVMDKTGAFKVLSAEDERFVNMLFDCVEKKWQDESFLVEDFSKQLSWSKSQIYRKMTSLLGVSPNNFIREYRLSKSIELLNSQESSIAEVAFEAGFSSPSYFTKCFQFRFGLTPSDYLQIINE